MIEVAFHAFVYCWLIAMAISVPFVLACLLAAPTCNDESHHCDYYGHGWNSVDHGDRRRGNAKEDTQDVLASEPAGDRDGLIPQPTKPANG